MVSAWDKFQDLIKAKMLEIYSETVVEHNMNPRNLGSFPDADSFARVSIRAEMIKVRGDADDSDAKAIIG